MFAQTSTPSTNNQMFFRSLKGNIWRLGAQEVQKALQFLQQMTPHSEDQSDQRKKLTALLKRRQNTIQANLTSDPLQDQTLKQTSELVNLLRCRSTSVQSKIEPYRKAQSQISSADLENILEFLRRNTLEAESDFTLQEEVDKTDIKLQGLFNNIQNLSTAQSTFLQQSSQEQSQLQEQGRRQRNIKTGIQTKSPRRRIFQRVHQAVCQYSLSIKQSVWGLLGF